MSSATVDLATSGVPCLLDGDAPLCNCNHNCTCNYKDECTHEEEYAKDTDPATH